MATPSLYLIRHGIAEERSDRVIDAERTLTDEGRQRTRQVAKRLHDLGLRFDLLLTSPLVRARQTSDIFAEVYQKDHSDLNVQVSDYLAPEGDFSAWLSWLASWLASGGNSLGVVGHEPDLSVWAERLVWGEPQNAIILKKAGIIGLSLPESGMIVGNSLLFLLIPPKLLI